MAMHTYRASSTWAGNGVRVITKARDFTLTLDEQPEMGGEDRGMSPMEALLAALGGCISVVVTAFAPELGVRLDNVFVDVEGDMDTDGFQGKNPDVRNGFQEIHISLRIESGSDPKKVDQLARLALERCPITDTLTNGTVVHKEYEVFETP